MKEGYPMQFLIFIFILFLAACGGKSGGGSSATNPVHIPDTTPHTYTAVFAALSNDTLEHYGTMHLLCDFGYSDVRDMTNDFVLVWPQYKGGMGCADASNYSLTAENTGDLELYLATTIDGVNQPDVIVAPHTTYTFSRGY